MTGTRPSFDAFLGQVADLSSEQGRELAEIQRLPDWRRDRDIKNFIPARRVGGFEMGYKLLAQQDVERTMAAIDEARRIVGADIVEAATRQATQTLTGRRLSWPGMGMHRPIRLMMWASLAAAAVLLLLRPTASDPATLVPFVLLLALAALAWFARYLLPPSEGDLRYVVELAAVAHIAGSSLPEEHFNQLSDGWYAILEGRWRRGRRPYRAWGCLLIGIVAVVLLGAVLEVTGAGR